MPARLVYMSRVLEQTEVLESRVRLYGRHPDLLMHRACCTTACCKRITHARVIKYVDCGPVSVVRRNLAVEAE